MNTNVKIEAKDGQIFVYEGKAPVIQDPEVISISGVIDSPFRWLEKRVETIQQLNAHIIVDRSGISISLNLEDKDKFGDYITGKAEFHPLFAKFAINADKYITNFDMAKLFKMNRSAFENQSTAMALVTELQNFKAKVAKEIEKLNDNRGNKTELQAQVVESNLPDKFNLVIPIFKGQPKQTIEVEVYINPSDFTCALVSPVANDLTESFRDSIIDNVLDQIKEICPNIVIIEV